MSEVMKSIVDICSEQQLKSVFAPILDLPTFCTKAEMISQCLNTELDAYWLTTHVNTLNRL